MPKYTALVGFNCPDPSGKRDKDGRAVEVRFEAGDDVTLDGVGEKSLKSLIESGAVKDETPAAEPEQAAAGDTKATKKK